MWPLHDKTSHTYLLLSSDVICSVYSERACSAVYMHWSESVTCTAVGTIMTFWHVYSIKNISKPFSANNKVVLSHYITCSVVYYQKHNWRPFWYLFLAVSKQLMFIQNHSIYMKQTMSHFVIVMLDFCNNYTFIVCVFHLKHYMHCIKLIQSLQYLFHSYYWYNMPQL